MNIFVVPTWYPHRCHPLEGIFVLEQAKAIGELHPDWNVGISFWGQGVGRVSVAHFRRSPRCLVDALRLPFASEQAVQENVIEFRSRALSWNERLFRGNRRSILEANRRNFEQAVRRFGKIDLIHAHVSYPAGWVAMRLSDETGVPFVVTEHMGPFPLAVYAQASGALRSFIREPLERAAARIAVSESLCDRIASFGIPRPEYVPNVIDERLYRLETHPGREPFVFFTLAGMYPLKGWAELLEAIAKLLEMLPATDRARVAFRFGGDGPQEHEYREQSRRLGLDPWVSWIGFLMRDAARREFHSCDCYVLPSRHESFGVVLVEAMATGKPVIATRCGGPESIVTPENGILVPVGRPDELAHAMLVILTRQKTFDPKAIREGVLHQYSRPAVVNRLEQIYRHVTEQVRSESRMDAVR